MAPPLKKRKLIESGTLNLHAGKVMDSLFLNNDFFDADDLLQVKYEMLRRVEKEGASVTEASREILGSRAGISTN